MSVELAAAFNMEFKKRGVKPLRARWVSTEGEIHFTRPYRLTCWVLSFGDHPPVFIELKRDDTMKQRTICHCHARGGKMLVIEILKAMEACSII